MTTERGMDHQTGGDLMSSVDNLRPVGEDLALNLRDCLRRVSADRASRAGLRRRPYLGASVRIHGVHRPDMSAIEFRWIRSEKVDLTKLLLLNVQNSIREPIELSGMVPVCVSNHDPGHGVGVQPDAFHLIGE